MGHFGAPSLMNTKVKRYITKALEVSLDSTYHRIHIGAVVVLGNRIVASGYNQAKSHTAQSIRNKKVGRITRCDSIHAELDALRRACKNSIRGADLYVARWDNNGRLGNCKPCPACSAAISEAGIRNVYYTDSDGIKNLRN